MNLKEITIIICISYLVFGYLMAELNLYFQWPPDWNFNSKRDNYVLSTSFLPTGGFLGSFIAFYFIYYYKRNFTILFWDIIAIISISISLTDSLFVFNIGRLISGITLGISLPLAMIYIKEISIVESKIQKGSSYLQLFTCIGNFGAFFFGFLCDYERELWRLLIAFPLVFLIFRVIYMIFKMKYEPPYFLIHNKNYEYSDGLESLSYYFPEIDPHILYEIVKNDDSIFKNNITYSSLFSRKYRFRILLGTLLMFLNQVCGINSVIFYSHHNNRSHNYDSIVLGSINLLGAISFVFLTRKMARLKLDLQKILFIGNFGILICLISKFFN